MGGKKVAEVAVVSVLASISSLMGGWFALSLGLSRSRMDQLVAIGAGFVLGGALFTLLPEAMSASPYGPVFIAAGYLGLFVAQQLSERASWRPAGPGAESVIAIAGGMLLHSVFDGAALGVVVHVDTHAGLVALLALFLHKVPEGFSLSAVVLSATGSRRRAMLAAGLMGLTTMVGAQATIFWSDALTVSHGALMGLAAGSFLYVGGSDMLPGVAEKGRSAWLLPIGAGLVYVLTRVVGVSHTH